MTCILCFNHFNEDERYGVYDYSEPTMITGAAMVEKVFGFSEVCKFLFNIRQTCCIFYILENSLWHVERRRHLHLQKLLD